MKNNNMLTTFEKELEILINQNSIESLSNTQDFILAEYLTNCLRAFNKAVARRDELKGNTPPKD